MEAAVWSLAYRTILRERTVLAPMVMTLPDSQVRSLTLIVIATLSVSSRRLYRISEPIPNAKGVDKIKNIFSQIEDLSFNKN